MLATLIKPKPSSNGATQADSAASRTADVSEATSAKTNETLIEEAKMRVISALSKMCSTPDTDFADRKARCRTNLINVLHFAGVVWTEGKDTQAILSKSAEDGCAVTFDETGLTRYKDLGAKLAMAANLLVKSRIENAGIDFFPTDIIRNYITARAPGDRDRIEYYSETWKEMLEVFDNAYRPQQQSQPAPPQKPIYAIRH